MDKHAVAIVLEEIGTLLEIQGENRFKARAFTGAARAVEKLEASLDQVVRDGRLQDIAGIGPATAEVIRELVATGTSQYYRTLREQTPSGLLELLAVPRLGATRIRQLHDELGIETLDDLEHAARDGRLARVKGFGEKTGQRILEGIAYVRSTTARRRYADAIELGERLCGFAATLPEVQRAELTGELRRGCETVAAIDVIIAIEPAHAQEAVQTFLALPGITRADTSADQEAVARLGDGIELRLIWARPGEFATRWLFTTGSAEHVTALNERANSLGLELSASGLNRGGQRVDVADEDGLYRALDLAYVPPELRESGGEVQAAAASKLPVLISYADLHGCFHNHTTYSDGKATVAQMAEAALERGWRYLGISDHSQYASYAGGLSPDDLRRQHIEIDAWNEKQGKKLWLFKGIEADILPDGTLDFDDRPDVLGRLDFVIGSIHSAFGLSAEDQTRRFLRALANPYLTILGHLTGRLLLARQGYGVDLERVFAAAAERNVAIEINSDPRRMELDWRHWPRAKEMGVRTAINPDAHAPRQLDFVHYGTVIARKGWLEKGDVVNTWTLADVKKFFRQARRA